MNEQKAFTQHHPLLLRQREKEEGGAGFTLLGILVALAIALIGLVAVLGLMIYSFTLAKQSALEFTASQLAQEGIEVVRNMRDSSADWTDWYNGFSGTSQCRVQYNSTSLMAYQDVYLKFDSSTGLYEYDSGSDSPFKRKIIIEKISDSEIKVVVEVSWSERGRSHIFQVEDRLWNWQ